MIVVEALGGLGIFLLGMVVLTEGLKALAGQAVRRAITRFTNSPASGALTGAIGTAILQSSSATTVAAVGFVSAGLLTFPQALGIVFGANIGTTITGWLVALVGFKLKLSTAVLPLIFVGVVMRLFARERVAAAGLALAGFGLIFVGIDTMQAAMAGIEDLIQPERLPGTTFAGTLALVGIGLVITVITQSSSAGVAIAITAVYTGTITFHQGAALVIGMDVGTTATAAIATIGGSVGARRTGYSHVIYNFITACGALLLIGPYQDVWTTLAPGQLEQNAEIALVAFHTTFNAIGVALVLPFAKPFARLIEWLVEDDAELSVGEIDPALLADPDLALNAVQHNTEVLCVELVRHVANALREGKGGNIAQLDHIERALESTQNFLDDVAIEPSEETQRRRMVELLHALDHLLRLQERCEEEADRARTAATLEDLANERRITIEALDAAAARMHERDWSGAARVAEKMRKTVHETIREFRSTILDRAARDVVDVPEATEALEAERWLKRVTRHIARATSHLEGATNCIGTKEPGTPI